MTVQDLPDAFEDQDPDMEVEVCLYEQGEEDGGCAIRDILVERDEEGRPKPDAKVLHLWID